MSYENELGLLRSVLEKKHIGSYLVDYDDEVLEAFNKEWLSFYSGVLNSGLRIRDVIQNVESNVIYKMSTPYSLAYIFLNIGSNILIYYCKFLIIVLKMLLQIAKNCDII